jgi:hypothetical protein
MSLLNNYSVLNSSPGRAIGNFTNLYSNYKPSSWYSYYIPDTTTTSLLKRASIFTGTEPPYSWIFAIKGGELSSSNTLAGSSTLTSGMMGASAMAVTLDGVGVLTAGLSIRIQLAATLTGTSTLVGNVSARIAMSATLAGTSVLTSGLSLTVKMASTMNGTATLTANLKGVARMEAQIYVNQSQATVEELVQGVWEAILANYDSDPDSAAAKLLAAGSAGDPWSTTLPASYTGNQAGKIVADLETLIKQVKALTAAGL